MPVSRCFPMQACRRLVRVMTSASILFALHAAQAGAPSTTPAPSNKPPWWPARHAQKVEEAKRGNVDMLFIGDSIVQGFEGAGQGVWARYYAPRRALNLGFNRDKTENVMWRLLNGEIDGLSPKLAIVAIGTNNTGLRRDKPSDILDGIHGVCDTLRKKVPGIKVLIVAILPRSPKPTDWERVNNEEVNKRLERLVDNEHVFSINVNSKLLQPDGSLSWEIMPDMLHPSAKGYEIWAAAMEPVVAKLMGEPAKK